MDNIQIIKTEKKNYYLVDTDNKIIQLIHPNLAKLFLYEDKYDCHSYYSKKKKYLERFIQLGSRKISRIKTMTAKDVENNIITTPQITFEVTDRCNFACEYCAYGRLYNNHDKRNIMDANIENSKAFIDYYYSLCKKNNHVNDKLMIGFYGGEPLMNIGFIRNMVEYIEGRYRRPYKYNITTNGVLLKRNIDFLIEKDFSLLISLDGDKDSNSYRIYKGGKQTFDDVKNNIQYIKNNFPEYYDKNVNFSVVLHNKNSIQEISDYFMSFYSKVPFVGRVNTAGVNPLYSESFHDMHQNSSYFNYKNLSSDEIVSKNFLITGRVRFLHNNLFFIYNDYLDIISDLKSNFIFPTSTCTPFSKKIFITTNGKILPCEKIGHNYCLGNLNNGEISIEFGEIADKYNNLFQKMYNHFCSSCRMVNNCQTCALQSEQTCKVKGGGAIFLKSELDFFEAKNDLFLKLVKDAKIV